MKDGRVVSVYTVHSGLTGDNAIKFTRLGGVTVTVGVEEAQDDGQTMDVTTRQLLGSALPQSQASGDGDSLTRLT